MAQASKSVLTNFGAFAGASILALGLVAAPPDPHGVRTESRAVQLTAATWPGATYLQALEDFVSQRAQTVVPAPRSLADGGAITSGATATTPTVGVTPVNLDSATESGTSGAATLAAPTTSLSAAELPSPISAILGFVAVLILFAPLIIGVILICPICAVINELSYIIPGVSPVPALSAAAPVPAEPTVLAESTTGEPAAPLADPEAADDSGPVTSTDKRDHKDLVAAKKPTKDEEPTAAETEIETKTEPAADSPEPPSGVSTPKTENGSVRDSHRGDTDRATTRTVAGAEGTPATSGSSSSAAPSHAKGNRPSRDDSSRGDADGS